VGDLFCRTGCIVVFSGTLYGDEKFPFEKETRDVGQDASWNIIDLERI